MNFDAAKALQSWCGKNSPTLMQCSKHNEQWFAQQSTETALYLHAPKIQSLCDHCTFKKDFNAERAVISASRPPRCHKAPPQVPRASFPPSPRDRFGHPKRHQNGAEIWSKMLSRRMIQKEAIKTIPEQLLNHLEPFRDAMLGEKTQKTKEKI